MSRNEREGRYIGRYFGKIARGHRILSGTVRAGDAREVLIGRSSARLGWGYRRLWTYIRRQQRNRYGREA